MFKSGSNEKLSVFNIFWVIFIYEYNKICSSFIPFRIIKKSLPYVQI
jgi:hypothetical protein